MSLLKINVPASEGYEGAGLIPFHTMVNERKMSTNKRRVYKRNVRILMFRFSSVGEEEEVFLPLSCLWFSPCCEH